MRRHLAAVVGAVAPLFLVTPLWGQSILQSVDAPDDAATSRSVWVPFAFYTESMEFAGGVGGASTGVRGQEQSFIGAAAFVSTNGSGGLYLRANEFYLEPSHRLFADVQFGFTRSAEADEFVDGNPNYPGPAGANDSDENDFVTSESNDIIGEVKLKYVLPIGHGKANPIARYKLKRGLLVDGASGATSINPLRSGRTTVRLTPFAHVRALSVEGDDTPESFNTYGLRLGARWDNTDFSLNPTRGFSVATELTRDFGGLDSSGAYTAIQFEGAAYVPLGQNAWFKQQVLAIDFWAVSEVSGDAPYYTGATLGGYNRLRGYPFNRFHDRNAQVTSLELRLTPNWRPRTTWDTLDKAAAIDWMQVVTFVEAGRVDDSFSTTLFSDMKWDAGVGLRLLAHHILLRADLAFGEEGANLWVMIGQAF